jgi:hypothetical protein
MERVVGVRSPRSTTTQQQQGVSSAMSSDPYFSTELSPSLMAQQAAERAAYLRANPVLPLLEALQQAGESFPHAKALAERLTLLAQQEQTRPAANLQHLESTLLTSWAR